MQMVAVIVDDVQQRQPRPEFAGKRNRMRDRFYGFLLEVGGVKDLMNIDLGRWKLAIASQRWRNRSHNLGAYRQHRTTGLTQNLFCDRSHNQLTEAGPPVRASNH